MKKAIVTGANGFVGGNLVDYLVEQGVEVYAIVRKKIKEDIEGKLHYIECDLKDVLSLDELLPQDIDCFFHLAWEGTYTNTYSDYALQAKNIVYCGDAVMLAKKIGCKKFIMTSTIAALEAMTCVVNGDAKFRYHHLYGGVKCAAEIACKTLAMQHGIEMNTVYLASIYGEGDKSKRIYNILVHNLSEGKESSFVVGEYLADWLYVKECVKGYFAVAEKGISGKSYYLGHRKLKPFKEWVTEARDIINPNVALYFGAYGADPEVDYSLVDLDALYRDTGFEAKEDFREAILNTAEWAKTLDWEI